MVDVDEEHAIDGTWTLAELEHVLFVASLHIFQNISGATERFTLFLIQPGQVFVEKGNKFGFFYLMVRKCQCSIVAIRAITGSGGWWTLRHVHLGSI
jgi:hypothetical protein